MLNKLSLKYRIALVIFVLEAIMLSTVLWTGFGNTVKTATEQFTNTQNVIIELLRELSVNALLTEEYGDLQFYFEHLQKDPTIVKIVLIDITDQVVADTNIKEIGSPPPMFAKSDNEFWRVEKVDSGAGLLGKLAVHFSNESILNSFLKARNLVISIAVVGMTIILMVGIAVGFALTRRLERISTAANQFAKGNNNAQSGVTGNDEVGALGETFDNMVKSVTAQQKELQQQIIQNQVILKTAHDGFVLATPDGRIQQINMAFCRLFGFNENTALKSNLFDLLDSDQEYVKNCFQKAIKIQNVLFELALPRKKQKIYLEISLSSVVLEGKTLLFGFFRDISERKQAEQALHEHKENLEKTVEQRTLALQKRSRQLEVANEEMEAFSYSVSHDLRAPLRSINGFCQALMEDYGNQLDSVAQEYFKRITDNTIHMGKLIDDLLNLSRISRQTIVRKTVDISAIATEIVDRLKESNKARHISFNIHEDMATMADPDLVKIALYNLIENAWKYTSKTENAEIEVGTTQINDDNVFFVRDNGAGFDMTYANKLFGAFQRLHSKEFEGTGIGLATVARILNRHEGRIWAEAEVNKGATFYFVI